MTEWRHYTPEKRYEIAEKAKTSPAYANLLAIDRLNWRDNHPILCLFSEPPLRKPYGYDDKMRREKLAIKEEINSLLALFSSQSEPSYAEVSLRRRLAELDEGIAP